MPGLVLSGKSRQSQQCGQPMPLHGKPPADTSSDRLMSTTLGISAVGSLESVNPAGTDGRVTLGPPAPAPSVRSVPAQHPPPAQRYGRGSNPLSRWR